MIDIKFKLWIESSKTMKQWDEIKDNLYASEIKNDENLTFLQYTGVKSFDGKEIYEGDIVTLINQKDKFIVIRGDYGWGFVEFDSNDCTSIITCTKGELELIGNAYEVSKGSRSQVMKSFKKIKVRYKKALDILAGQ